jgi:hypothetical protein
MCPKIIEIYSFIMVIYVCTEKNWLYQFHKSKYACQIFCSYEVNIQSGIASSSIAVLPIMVTIPTLATVPGGNCTARRDVLLSRSLGPLGNRCSHPANPVLRSLNPRSQCRGGCCCIASVALPPGCRHGIQQQTWWRKLVAAVRTPPTQTERGPTIAARSRRKAPAATSNSP